jgi:transcriptional regulator with GAF, ATPase, and Fis domain
MDALSAMNANDAAGVDAGRLPAATRHAMPPLSGGRFVADTSTALLRTIAEALDVRTVFPRVSEIVRQVLPHDALVLVLFDAAGHVMLEARSSDDLPKYGWRASSGDKDHFIVPDLSDVSSRITACEPAIVDALVEVGYRSLLSIRGIALGQVMRLGFVSRQMDAYTAADVAAAQHIAGYVALAVAHEQLAGEARARAEARGRSERVEARVRTLAEKGELLPAHGRMIGRSEAWQRVLTRVLRVAPTETTVFLQGESGTGKEVVARFIHQASPRKDGPFVAINCAALPEHLLESELFGYERGAFTGAHQTKPGQIELASRGVLFLDEVSEMSLVAQAKFLRFLQEREFQRLGGTRMQKANVRVIAASNRDLRQAVERGTFREDLFYRLHDDARDALMAHSWPGNVRELRNVLERAAIMSDDGVIERRHVSLHVKAAPAPSPHDLGAIERQTIETALRETDWNKSKAARRLGLTRTQLYVRLRRYGLENESAI